MVLEISRYQGDQTSAADRPIFQNEARSSFLLLSFRAGATIDQLVAELREDEESKALRPGRLDARGQADVLAGAAARRC